MRFYYQAQRVTGEIERGEIEAASKKEAITRLESLGLFPIYLEEIKPSILGKEIRIEIIGEKDLILFYRQLSFLVSGGVSLVEALKIIGGQTAKKGFREIILEIAKEIGAGKKFSEALSSFPNFSPFQVSLIKIGEETGKLSESLILLCEHLEHDWGLENRIITLLLYPSLVLFIITAILIFIFLNIIPGLEPIFLTSQISLPLITKILISLSHFFRQFLFFLVVSFLLLSFYLYFIREKMGAFFSKFLLSFPLIKESIKKIYLARIALSLSILQEAGLSILESLTLTAEFVGNALYQKEILNARERIEKGFSLSSALGKNSQLFPPIFSAMILVGEQTGRTAESMKKISNFFQEEVERTMENFLRILEPLLILILGLLVGIVVYSFYLPLYRIISSAGEGI